MSNPGLLANQITGFLAGRSVRIVPGSDIGWTPPMGEQLFNDFLERVGDIVKTQIPAWVVQLPRDRRRRRFNLLILDNAANPIAFAKFTANPRNPLTLAALERFRSEPTRRFWSPSLLAAERVGAYEVTLSTAMPNERHRPAQLSPVDRRWILDEIQNRLGDLVVPHVITHGDFAPWNVRRFGNGRVAVVDWEEMTPGVDLADEVWFVVCVHARTGGGISRVLDDLGAASRNTQELISSAAQFWLDRLRRPESDEIDRNLAIANRLDRFGLRVKDLLESLR